MELGPAGEGSAGEVIGGAARLGEGVEDYAREFLFVFYSKTGHRRIVSEGGEERLILRTEVRGCQVMQMTLCAITYAMTKWRRSPMKSVEFDTTLTKDGKMVLPTEIAGDTSRRLTEPQRKK